VVSRPLVEFVCAETLASSPLVTPLSPDPVSAKVLAGDVEAGDGAVLVDLPGGWRGRPREGQIGFELVVLEGEFLVEANTLGPESYVALPSDSGSIPLSCSVPTRVFLDVSQRVGEQQVLPASDSGWSPPRVPGPPPGLVHKLLRGDPLAGPSAFLLRVPPGWSEMRTEWHECSEQCLVLDGDLWHDRANEGTGGTMTKHCYFWRPPLILHSPMGTTSGVSMFMTTDGPLVNHYVEEEGPPPSGEQVRYS
jgi:hypothetical protein